MVRNTAGKRTITLRIPEDLASLLQAESIRDGQDRRAGRVYSPSATVERILREYFAAQKRPHKSK